LHVAKQSSLVLTLLNSFHTRDFSFPLLDPTLTSSSTATSILCDSSCLEAVLALGAWIERPEGGACALVESAAPSACDGLVPNFNIPLKNGQDHYH
jgi:hypothetical protein